MHQTLYRYLSPTQKYICCLFQLWSIIWFSVWWLMHQWSVLIPTMIRVLALTEILIVKLISIDKCRAARFLCYRTDATKSWGPSRLRTGKLLNVIVALYSWKERCMELARFISAGPMKPTRVSFSQKPISPRPSVLSAGLTGATLVTPSNFLYIKPFVYLDIHYIL